MLKDETKASQHRAKGAKVGYNAAVEASTATTDFNESTQVFQALDFIDGLAGKFEAHAYRSGLKSVSKRHRLDENQSTSPLFRVLWKS